MLNTVKLERGAITPTKIVCVGQNYTDHIKEMGSQVADDIVIFCKPNSAITSVLRSVHEETLHYEAELCLMIKNGNYSHAGVGLDLTKRSLQKKLRAAGLPWEKAKAFNGAALFSEFVPLTCPTDELSFTLSIGGDIVQSGSQALMLYKPAEILEAVEKFISLNDGDIIMTGTPCGVGPVQTGHIFTACLLKNGENIVSKSWTAE